MSEAPHRYTAAMADEIELRWQQRWDEEGTFHADNPVGALRGAAESLEQAASAEVREKMYIMDMFPYPSGSGLHVGHPLGYIATDVVARHQRMLGRNVLYTMGYDAFGLPAEQYAVQTGTHPRTTTEANVANMRRQLHRLGLSHDARRSLATTDPEFVKWTQWIFLRVFDSWYDPDAPNADGITGRARPIAELREGLGAGTIDPFALADRQGLELPEAWQGRDAAEVPAASEAEIAQLADSFRLAYISETPVNWCPGLGTVLANEEVTAEGRSERGNFPVFTRRLRQWNMRITAYGDRLIDDLDRVDWPESIRAMQRNWIGRSHGAEITFPVSGLSDGSDAAFDVFTTRADTLFGATFCVLSPEHSLLADASALPEAWPEGTKEAWTGGAASPREAVTAYQARAASLDEDERTAEGREKTGVFTGLVATNPMDGRALPVFTADYVLTGYGTGAIMAVPAEDERDFAFADRFDLPVIRTVRPPEDFEGGAWTGEGEKINSASADLDLNGLDKDEAKTRATAHAEEKGFGRARTTYRLRDWLFSRQRYWGEPFPIVYDPADPETPIPVPDSMLPVDLPEVADFSPKTFDPLDADTEPQTPLSRASDWVDVELDLGDGPKIYRRETNTMPQWAGSSWYHLRYIDPTEDEVLVRPENEKYWLGTREDGGVGGVDLYVGGVEHAVLHLLYARFWHKVLFDRGDVSSQEPFHRLFNQGYIQAFAYTDARGVHVPAEDVVEEADGTFTYQGEPVAQEYGKMGKSLKNAVAPDDMYEEYGADTLRVYEMSMGPLDLSRPWETRAVVGSQRFLQRLWRLVVDEETGRLTVTDEPADLPTTQAVHRTIDGVGRDMERMQFNTAIAKLIELVNHLTKQLTATGTVPREAVEPLVLMVAPLAPHLAEELWVRLGHTGGVSRIPYPVAEPELLKAEQVTCVVQVKGKVRHRLEVDPEISAEDLEAAVMAEPRVQELLEGQTLRKVIVRAPKIVNLVV
ncbi:leucine--tRNA ligase [Brachybacterium saurashtrense]|uniref:Leucine--tRNA ligase n=1 Tax=Brachybacterium saurashtrense TaxID=556288 RepID=A0A345YLJ0_9MICO|nr:leucine--tRNA ligase [Brachybacterium saurashtrense]AXK44792.1 leucine--tRNA ligase [Brachybacterium saurashtrense]RRR23404.1 leucine--tRNA ligase [Brachybacterium saurashtrense]